MRRAGGESELFRSGRSAVHAASEPLLQRAQEVGVARAEASFDDVLRLMSGTTMIPFVVPGQRERVSQHGPGRTALPAAEVLGSINTSNLSVSA